MRLSLAILLALVSVAAAQERQHRVENIISVTPMLSWPGCNPQNTADINLNVRGVTPGDMVNVTAPQSMQYAGAVYSGWVYAPGRITVRLTNITPETWQPIGPGRFRITVFKFR